MISSLLQWLINLLVSNPLIFAALFGMIGLIYFFMYSNILRADRKNKNWPSVLGKIEYSHVKKIQTSITDFYDIERSGGGTRYLPKIEYSYTVAGTTFQGKRIGNGIYPGFGPGGPKRLIKRYPQGASVQVYYDPANPKASVLEKTSASSIVGYIFSIIFCLTSLLFLGIWVYHIFVK
jgi:hypothetical protein